MFELENVARNFAQRHSWHFGTLRTFVAFLATRALEEQGLKIGLSSDQYHKPIQMNVAMVCRLQESGLRWREEFTNLEIILRRTRHPGTHWEGERGVHDAETNMAVYGTQFSIRMCFSDRG